MLSLVMVLVLYYVVFKYVRLVTMSVEDEFSKKIEM